MKKLLALALSLALLFSCAHASDLDALLGLLSGDKDAASYSFTAYDLLKYAATGEIARMDSCIIESRADPAMAKVTWLCYDESEIVLWLRGTNPDGRQEYTRWEFVSRGAGLRFIGLVLADYEAVAACLPKGYTLRVDWPGGSVSTADEAARADLTQRSGVISAHAEALEPLWPYDYTRPSGPTPPPQPGDSDGQTLELVQVTKEIDCPSCTFGNCPICNGKGYYESSGVRKVCDPDCPSCDGEGKIEVTEYEWQYR